MAAGRRILLGFFTSTTTKRRIEIINPSELVAKNRNRSIDEIYRHYSDDRNVVGSSSFACLDCRLLSSSRESSSISSSQSIRSYSTSMTTNSPQKKLGIDILNGRFWNLMQRYEDVIGLTDVKEAQKSVLQAERDFERMQDVRRTKQDEIQQVQSQLKEIHVELDKTSRGEDRYLDLLTSEHAVIKRERSMIDDFKRLERAERDSFNVLSTRLRESHEKERERAERTKYWSIIGSAIGALLGIIGTTVNNRLRIRELRQIVEQGSEPGRVQTVIGQLSDVVRNQQEQVAGFVADLKAMLNSPYGSTQLISTSTLAHHRTSKTTEPDQWLSPVQSAEIMRAIREQDKKIDSEMQEIKKLIATEHGYSMKQDGTIIYVGPEMQALLEQTENNIDLKLKVTTLIGVVALYGALALTLPLLYSIFKGS